MFLARLFFFKLNNIFAVFEFKILNHNLLEITIIIICDKIYEILSNQLTQRALFNYGLLAGRAPKLARKH